MATRVRKNVQVTVWDQVLVRGGLAMAVLLAAAAIGLRDLEAAAFTVGGLVALGLLRFRGGLLGRLGLGVLGADVAFWMAAGAISNVAHGEGFWETALPSALTIAGVTTLVSAIGATVSRVRRTTSTTGPRVIEGIALVATVLVVIASAVGVGGADRAVAGDVTVDTKNVKFVPDELTATSGQIEVVVANKDLFWHTFTIKELDVNVNVPVGAERRATFAAQAGTYEFICAIPGHTQAGMNGTLTVH